jgi:Winged helix-turn helix
VLLTADGCGTEEIMRQTGTAKTTVWRWQERFMTEGVAGLLRDKTPALAVSPLSRGRAARRQPRFRQSTPQDRQIWAESFSG